MGARTHLDTTTRIGRYHNHPDNRLDYLPFCEAVCETCGDDPEMLTIAFETKNGERHSQYYDYFGLPNILEALDKWNKQYGKVVENRG